MSIAPQLERELIDAARRVGAPASATARTDRRRRHLSRQSLVAVALVTLLVLAAAALAATDLLQAGGPVTPPPGTPLTPKAGLGIPVPTSVRLLALRVPDPAGGPPWGARYVATTRGVACLQIGRLVRGEIGVIGQDGAFGNDGRFHPLATDYLGGPFPCGTQDAHGHAFASVVMYGEPASGFVTGQACTPIGRSDPRGRGPRMPHCAARAERLIVAGLAGPLARTVTSDYAGHTRTVSTSGSDGAYLIVLAASSFGDLAGEFTPSSTPAIPPIVRITYRNGTSCDPRATASGCAPYGRVRAVRHLGPNAVKAPISVAVGRAFHQEAILLSWIAHENVTSASSGYSVTAHFPGVEPRCGFTTVAPVDSDVRRGQRVHFALPTNGCSGTFHITVTFSQGETSGIPPSAATASLLVGSRTLTIR